MPEMYLNVFTAKINNYQNTPYDNPRILVAVIYGVLSNNYHFGLIS